MGMFIELRVSQERCRDASVCHECVRVCPVDVFRLEEDTLVLDHENEDECTLCELCLKACPREAIRIGKLYGECA